MGRWPDPQQSPSFVLFLVIVPPKTDAPAARTGPIRALRVKVSELEKEILRLEENQAELTSALEAPET